MECSGLQHCVSFKCTAKWFSYTYTSVLFQILFLYRLLQNKLYIFNVLIYNWKSGHIHISMIPLPPSNNISFSRHTTPKGRNSFSCSLRWCTESQESQWLNKEKLIYCSHGLHVMVVVTLVCVYILDILFCMDVSVSILI